MNDCINVLQTRRSVKGYKDTPVPEGVLKEILKAGENAPTGMNRQSPVMVAVTNPETVRQFGIMNGEIMGSSMDAFYGAPVVVIVFADSTVPTYKEDGCLVMGNLLNATAAMGLGGCWIHRAKEMFETPEGRKWKEKWGLDERFVGIGNCIIGYPDRIPDTKTHKPDYVIFD